MHTLIKVFVYRCVFVCVSVSASVCPSVFVSVGIYICLFLTSPVCMFDYCRVFRCASMYSLFVYLFVCLCVYFVSFCLLAFAFFCFVLFGRLVGCFKLN